MKIKYMIGGKEYKRPGEFRYDLAQLDGHTARSVLVSVAVQQEMIAKDRYERETDPLNKAIMERMITNRDYNFDAVFGKE